MRRNRHHGKLITSRLRASSPSVWESRCHSPSTVCGQLLVGSRRATMEERLHLRKRDLSILVGVYRLETFGMGRLEFLQRYSSIAISIHEDEHDAVHPAGMHPLAHHSLAHHHILPQVHHTLAQVLHNFADLFPW